MFIPSLQRNISLTIATTPCLHQQCKATFISAKKPCLCQLSNTLFISPRHYHVYFKTSRQHNAMVYLTTVTQFLFHTTQPCFPQLSNALYISHQGNIMCIFQHKKNKKWTWFISPCQHYVYFPRQYIFSFFPNLVTFVYISPRQHHVYFST